jgi:hypothetical protein
MRQRLFSSRQDTTHLALLFFAFAGLLVVFGLLLKVFLIYHASVFDGAHQFVLQIRQSSGTQVIAFNPDTNSAVILSAKEDSSDLGTILGVPVDATISSALPASSLVGLTQELLFHPKEHMPFTLIDRIRLFLFANNVKPTAITTKQVTIPVDPQTKDVLIPQLFTDHTIYSENMSISVINATQVSGIASKVARLITVLGANVVSVKGNDKKEAMSSLVYTGKVSYTTRRLEKLFGVKAQQSTKAMLSDITLTIGEDTKFFK